MFDPRRPEIVPLPPSILGDDRHLEIGLNGQGDVSMALWQDSADFDDLFGAARFSFAHGWQATLLASLAGFLTRSDVPRPDINSVMLEAGRGVLADAPEVIGFQDGHYILQSIAEGRELDDANIDELGLSCLVRPMSSQPGPVEQVGGTGIYTRRTPESTILVFRRTNEEHTTAEFATEDVPIMGRLICNLALGVYRPGFQAFLRDNFLG